MNDNSIYPCIWFDGNAKEAMQFYCSIFPDSKIVSDTALVVTASISGQLMMGLNGGPAFIPNASISFMVMSASAEETNRYWEALIKEGLAFMPIDSYEWSQRYGWVQDKYGVSWQLYTGDVIPHDQKIVPTLMFAESQQGRAEEAIHFYTKIFQPSSLHGILKYPRGEFAGQVQHAQFRVKNYTLMAMDSGVPQTFSFTEGISLVLQCDTQEEIDYYWDAFTKDGAESMCGWCRDQFGLSWQVIPRKLEQLMTEPDRGKRVMDALLKMKKLDIAQLESA